VVDGAGVTVEVAPVTVEVEAKSGATSDPPAARKAPRKGEPAKRGE